MMVSRKTLKRKIGAALIEKVLQMFQERWACGQGHLLFVNEEDLNFSLAKFLNDFDFKGVTINKEVPKSGYNPILEPNNGIRLKDYIESRQCEIQDFNFKCLLEKKENLLFSKNEQKYKASGKDLKKREHDELNVLEFVEDTITKNNFKMEIDLTDKNKKSNHSNSRKEKQQQSTQAEHKWGRSRAETGDGQHPGRLVRHLQNLYLPQRLGTQARRLDVHPGLLQVFQEEQVLFGSKVFDHSLAP